MYRRPNPRMYEFDAVALHYQLPPTSKTMAYDLAVRSERARNMYRSIYNSFDDETKRKLHDALTNSRL
jgi:hypothetical protein